MFLDFTNCTKFFILFYSLHTSSFSLKFALSAKWININVKERNGFTVKPWIWTRQNWSKLACSPALVPFLCLYTPKRLDLCIEIFLLPITAKWNWIIYVLRLVSIPSLQKGPSKAVRLQSHEYPLYFSIHFPSFRQCIPLLPQWPEHPGFTPGVTFALPSRSSVTPLTFRERMQPRNPLCPPEAPKVLQQHRHNEI